MTLLPRSIAWMLALLGADAVFAQHYPNKPVRIITGEAGGVTELGARIIAPALSNILGQPVIIENRTSVVSIEHVSRAVPDGYTILMGPNSIWIDPLLRKSSWDPVRDFSPISHISSSPNIFVVHPSLPANSVAELIQLAKARPGTLNYGSSGSGTSTHLAGELLKYMAGVDIARIPYKGGAANMIALLSNEVQLSFSTAGTVTPYLKSGKLRALAVASALPSALVPGLPTVAASGLPGFESASISGMLAPAKTPATIIRRLSQEIAQLVNKPEVKEQFLKAGVEAVGSSPAQLAATMKAEIARWGPVINAAGIRAE